MGFKPERTDVKIDVREAGINLWQKYNKEDLGSNPLFKSAVLEAFDTNMDVFLKEGGSQKGDILNNPGAVLTEKPPEMQLEPKPKKSVKTQKSGKGAEAGKTAKAEKPKGASEPAAAAEKQTAGAEASTIDKDTAAKLDRKLGTGFTKKLEEMSERLGVSAEDVLAILCLESTLKTNAKNGSHSGLLQIEESRLRKYGTTGAALRKMNGVQQLDYIEKYFKEELPKLSKNDLGNLYTLVLAPGRIKKETVSVKGESVYNNNSRLDVNKDGKLTKSELAAHAKSKLKSTLKSLK